MSAQSVLAGLMPPLENNNVLPIPWQPVAINTLARNDDIVSFSSSKFTLILRDFLINLQLLAQKKPCIKYDTILQKLYKTPPPELDKLNEDNKALYKLLSKNTGKVNKTYKRLFKQLIFKILQNISNVLDVELLYTTLKTEEEVSLALPDWTENIYPEEMRPLAERSYTLFTETHLMKRIKGGAFLTEILKKMQNKRRKNLNPDRKIFLYSAHDVTLVNVMNSLGILDQTAKLPEYASALVFELHHSKSFADGDFEVKVNYHQTCLS